MGFRLVPLQSINQKNLATFWNRAFTGHLSDFQKNQESLALRLKQGNADQENSLILMDQNRFAGLSLFGRLGKKGEILGFGIDPDYRGRALAPRLIKQHVKQLSTLELDELGLEVISQNHAARRAYESAGFRPTRELISFSGPLCQTKPMACLQTATALRPLPIHRSSPEAFRQHRLRLTDTYPPSYERSFPFWSAHPVSPQLRMAGDQEAPAALLATRVIKGELMLVDGIGSREGLAALLSDALIGNPGWTKLTCVDEPVGSPLARLLQELGVPEQARFTEMLLRRPVHH